MKTMKKYLGTICMIVMMLITTVVVSAVCVQAGDPLTAQTLKMDGSWTTVQLSNGDAGFHKLIIPADGEVKLSYLNYMQKNHYIWVMDMSMNLLGDCMGIPGGNTSNPSSGTYTIPLSKGTYIVKIVPAISWSGTYKVSAKFTAYTGLNDQAAGSDFSEAQSIRLGDKIKGAVTRDDPQDYYRFQITTAGRYVIYPWGPGDAVMAVYNSVKQPILGNNGGGAATGTPNILTLEPGTYYIRVFCTQYAPYFLYGSYTLSVVPYTTYCTHPKAVVKTCSATYFHGGYKKHICDTCGKIWYTDKKPALDVPTPVNVRARSRSNYIRVLWNLVPKVSGYQIRYGTSKTNTKIVTVYGQNVYNKILPRLTKGKTYYYQVRSFAKANGKTVFSKFGSWKTQKVPK